MTRVGVVTFPGSLDDVDAARAVSKAGGEPVSLWHDDADIKAVDAVILPGGFSFGDYLRAGAIASLSPVVETVVKEAAAGLPVLGICNGFQILCEVGLLPGALTRNAGLRFVCRDQRLRVEDVNSPWLRNYYVGQELVIPVKNGEGCYQISKDELSELERSGMVFLRYIEENPNGSLADVAGVRNAQGNVLGLMPHPEHAIDVLTGPSTDGLGFFSSIVDSLVKAG
ncbi:MAG: phosphoribosylformylglycinamidine synthase subunit PurQ [Actinobacteria bacterium]|nr:phosphoribosylformylglycinamidine synthase subunit PurQ [Actinomycetota bacterium]